MHLTRSKQPMEPGQYATVSGVKIHYTEAGRPPWPSDERPTLVLVHGFAASAETWYDIYNQLAAKYHVIAVDLKGSGFSDKPADDNYHIRDHAQLITEFIQQQNLQRIVLVAHSYGGAVAILTYYLLKSRKQTASVCGLILLDSAGFAQNYPFQVEAYRNPLIRFLITNFTSSTWRTNYGLRRIFSDDARVTPDRVERYAYFYDLPGSHRALTQTAEQMDADDSELIVVNLGTISVPSLIIWGTQDPVIPASSAQRFADAIPGAQLALIEAGHVPHEERPSETLDVIFPFLEKLECKQMPSS